MQAEMATVGGEPQATLIRGKLRPPRLPEQRVVRLVEHRLADLIERHRLVVVSATAGAGKSTAVAAATEQLELPVAWLTVDWTDAAAGRLVTYLEAALAGQLPHVKGVATRALAAGIPHAEAAGLQAEAIGRDRLLLVLDELERLGERGDAWQVIEALVRYAPAGLRIVLISRRSIPVALGLPRPGAGSPGVIGEVDLAFSAAEAAEALGLLGEKDIDARAAVEATGGWVTGVLFEAWRSAGHVRGAGGEADPLHGYLAAHILGALAPRDREFLVTTALLDEVRAPRAAALGETDAAERLASLRNVHLPVTWEASGAALRPHPRFREYLLDRLERRGSEELRALRRAHGRLLAREGRLEEATDELLRAGARDEALATAEQAIAPLIERLDFAVAERWLDALEDAVPGSAALATAELMLAMAREDFRRAVRFADRLAARGNRDRLARSSELAAVLMGWCYAHLGRVDELEAVIAAAEPGTAADVLRYATAAIGPHPPPPRPEPTGRLVDTFVLSVDYVYGRLGALVEERPSGWVEAVAEPWRIAALSVTGHTREALGLYEAIRAHGVGAAWLQAYVGPQLLIDVGRRDEAYEEIVRAEAAVRATGSLHLELSAGLMEAKLALRLDRDPEAARAPLDRLEARPYGRRFALMAEQTDMWYGLALLLEGRDAEALERLRRAVGSMTAGDRILELPTAAVYLAEAEWRAGHEEAADAAADLALDAARRQGSNHVLLRALADFPAVASRRIDAEPAADSPWHDVGRALLAQGAAIEATVRAAVELKEFGRRAILVGGEEVRPRIAKTYELLAQLSSKPGMRARREELLDALFDGRSDESARAYLRQAIRWLRHVLPDAAAVEVERGEVRLSDAVGVTSESTWFEARLAEAARLRGGQRLTATLDALAVYDQGEYLPGADTRWVDERRRQLAELAVDARYEAADLAFSAGRLGDAERLAGEVLRADPYREPAWRLTMELAGALGDAHGVIRAYQRCEAALAEIGAEPAATTRQLLERLRR